MIDKKGEKSIDMAIGALSVSSELNDKNNTPIIAKGQFDVLSMDANLGIRDEGFEVGANMNIVSASGNIGLSIGTKEMEVRLSIGGSVGINTGFYNACRKPHNKRKGNLSKSHFHKYKNFDYFYDIWSNIHYGYVGRFCGISEQFLLLGSNLQQLYANLTSWKFFSGDDSADIISMKLGMRLYDEFKDNENGLTYTVVLERLEGLTSVGESRLLHTCLDKSWEGITFV